MIPKTKTGDCSVCGREATHVVKVKKDLYCLSCRRRLSNNKLQPVVSDKSELDKWFIHRSKEMTGKCIECGEKTTKGDPKYWKFSICHILPKSIFKSVATHPLNFVELCFFGNSHHTNMDNNGYEYVRDNMPKTWAFMIKRIVAMYDSIEEKSKLPDVITDELHLKLWHTEL